MKEIQKPPYGYSPSQSREQSFEVEKTLFESAVSGYQNSNSRMTKYTIGLWVNFMDIFSNPL